MQIQRLPWDSQFFDLEVARVQPESQEATADEGYRVLREASLDLLYWPTQRPRADLESHFVLTQVELSLDLQARPPHDDAITAQLTIFHGTPDRTLVNLAIEAGWSSRFRVDPGFGNDAFEKLYRVWIERSCSGEIADAVVVAGHEGQTTGLLTLSMRSATAKIGLVAVAENFRGLGIGQQLMQWAAELAADAGCRQLNVVTQSQNQAALNLYARCGYQPIDRVHWHHVWARKE